MKSDVSSNLQRSTRADTKERFSIHTLPPRTELKCGCPRHATPSTVAIFAITRKRRMTLSIRGEYD